MKTVSAIVLLLSGVAWCGEIRARLDSDEPVLKAWAVHRLQTDEGFVSRSLPARVEDEMLVADDLPVPGRFDLRFQVKSGFLEGWDATVPESDYVEEQPLSEASRATILSKMSASSFTAYWDRVVILDIQGNIQNAAVLRAVLRTRPFVGGGYRPGEWTWRVERWQWEDPMEHTWTTHQDRPYYALVRRRMFERDHRALRTTYARHLGGIALTSRRPRADLGPIRLPRPMPGTHAVNPDGSRVAPVLIKPATEPGGAP